MANATLPFGALGDFPRRVFFSAMLVTKINPSDGWWFAPRLRAHPISSDLSPVASIASKYKGIASLGVWLLAVASWCWRLRLRLLVACSWCVAVGGGVAGLVAGGWGWWRWRWRLAWLVAVGWWLLAVGCAGWWLVGWCWWLCVVGWLAAC